MNGDVDQDLGNNGSGAALVLTLYDRRSPHFLICEVVARLGVSCPFELKHSDSQAVTMCVNSLPS